MTEFIKHIELRLFSGSKNRTSFVFRIRRFLIRLDWQDNYTSLSFESLGKNFKLVGGMSWKEYRLAIKQRRAVEAEKERIKAEKYLESKETWVPKHPPSPK